MLETTTSGVNEPDEAVVRHYLAAVSNGRYLDALNTFSMDASFRDESGLERHGIREIAAAFVHRERPVHVEIEDLRHEGEVVAVRFRMTARENRTPRTYRSLFRVRKDRIHSLETAPWPSSGRTRPPLVQSV